MTGDNRPPYISSQQMRLLTDTQHPRRHMQAESFQQRREEGESTEADNRWVEVSREDVALDQVQIHGQPCSLRRLVITTDAGMGKTATLQWLNYRLNGPRSNTVAFFIPLNKQGGAHDSPLHLLEHTLHPYVAFLIMPVFAFANAGVPVAGLSMDVLTQPVPLGIMTGLFFGKQIGVFGFAWLAVMLRIGRLPERVNWLQLYGVSALCGIGFTMSLFISSLAAEQAGTELLNAYRLGILEGSLLSAVIGYLILSLALRKTTA